MKIIIIIVSVVLFPWLISYILPALWLWLVDSVKARWYRLTHREPPVFDRYGVHIFCGRVGCGKTISMIRKAEQLKKKYPKLKIYSNFMCSLSDGVIDSWEDIINITNFDEKGINQGVLFLFTEFTPHSRPFLHRPHGWYTQQNHHSTGCRLRRPQPDSWVRIRKTQARRSVRTARKYPYPRSFLPGSSGQQRGQLLWVPR